MRVRLMKSLLPLILFSFLSAAAFAQQVVVTHGVDLRPTASSAQTAIRVLPKGETLQLIDPDKQHGYYHVRTTQSEEGWVYGRYVQVGTASLTADQSQPASTTPNPATPQTPATVPAPTGSPSASISPDWEKPSPVSGTFPSGEGSCGPNGTGGDSATNVRKNRTDVPDNYHEVTWTTVGALTYPSAPTSRLNWSAAQLAQIAPYEGVAISIVGYLAKAPKVESGGSGESTNCHNTQPNDVDWHMYLTAAAKQGMDSSIIVETTPRVRPSHQWTVQKLAPWSGTDLPVRISGWLMLDPEHTNMVGKYRGTDWEIHPVTKIEVMQNNQWVDLDQMP